MFNGHQYSLLDAPPSDPQACLHDGDVTNPLGVLTSTQTMLENQRFPTACLFSDDVYSSVDLVGSCHNQSHHSASISHINPHFLGRDASDNVCEGGGPAGNIGSAPSAIRRVLWSTREQGVSSSVHWVGESELGPNVQPSASTMLAEPAHYPNPTWSTTALTSNPSNISANGDARSARKRVTDAARGREQTEARARLRVLFPASKCSNAVTRTATKVIMYLTTTGDVPESMTIVEDWWKLKRGEERTSDTLNPGPNCPAGTRATSASLSEAARKARQKELKKTADRIRNATLKSLEKELCVLFSPCTILEALQRASDYLAFAKKTGRGGIPTSSSHWHGSWADHTGPFFTDA